MEIRDRRNENTPAIVLLVDELVDLVSQGGDAVTQALMRLVQRGHETDIHVVAATRRPAAAILSGLLRNFPLRLVGKAKSVEDARVAAGRAKTDAHLLSGRGDFLAVGGNALPIRFQTAFIKERDARKKIAQL